jgi:hypothetical protein
MSHFLCTTALTQLPRMATAAVRGRIIRDFQSQLYKTCGIRTIVVLTYADEDGVPQVAMYVTYTRTLTGHQYIYIQGRIK